MLAHPESQPRKVFGPKNGKKTSFHSFLIGGVAFLLLAAVGMWIRSGGAKPSPMEEEEIVSSAPAAPVPAPVPVVPAAKAVAVEKAPAPVKAPAPAPVKPAPAPEPVKKAEPPAPKAVSKAVPKTASKPAAKAKAPAPKAKEKEAPAKPAREVPPPTYEFFKSPQGLKVTSDSGARLKVRSAQVAEGTVLELAYHMGDGKWAQVSREMNADLSQYEWLRFSMVGEGEDNTFEFRIEDEDGTVSGMQWLDKTNKWPWVPISLPLGQLKPLNPGGNGVLDWDSIKRVSFMVSVKAEFNDKGGEGRIQLKDVKFLSAL